MEIVNRIDRAASHSNEDDIPEYQEVSPLVSDHDFEDDKTATSTEVPVMGKKNASYLILLFKNLKKRREKKKRAKANK